MMRTTTKLAALLLVAVAASVATAPTASAAACDEIVANGMGARQPAASHGYLINSATWESDDRPADVLLSITGGADSWNSEHTDCWHLRQNPDRVEHVTELAGFTALRANPSMADGHNVVDFGTFGGQPAWGSACTGGGALACATRFRSPVRNHHIIDADIRFDVWWDWYDGRGGGNAYSANMSQCHNQYDLWSIAAHEFGHTLGFNHASGSSQTMYFQAAGTCNISRRTLGAADVYGYRSYYAQPVSP